MNKTHKDIFQSNNYLILDNFIESERAGELYKQFKEDVKTNPQSFQVDDQCPLSFSIYNYRPFLNILCEKIKVVSDIMEESMLPTYTYARFYKNSEIMKSKIKYNLFFRSDLIHFNFGPIAIAIKNGTKKGAINLL